MGLRDALDAVRDEALALDARALRQVKTDIPAAVITVRGALPALRALREEVVAAFREIDLAQYDNIELYARALTQANGEYLAQAPLPSQVPGLTEQLKEIRTTLLTDVRAAVRRRLVDRSHLHGLHGANGGKNTATDVVTLCALVREKWPVLAGRTLITLAELDQAEQLAEALQSALARADHADASVAATLDMRQRVYTLFFNAYDQARRAVAFLRWSKGDAHQIAPSLMALRSKGSRKKEEERTEPQGAQPSGSPLPVDLEPAAITG